VTGGEVAPPPPPEDAPRLLRAVLGATFFVRFGFGLTISVFASYILGHSVAATAEGYGVVGLVASLASVGEFSTVIFLGAAADRYGRFKVLLVGMAFASVLLAAISFTRSPAALGGINFLFGIASGAILAASLAVVGDQADPENRGYEMGRFDAVNLLGWILGFAVGFGIEGSVPNLDLAWTFRVGAAALLGGLVFAFASGRRHPETGVNDAFNLRRIASAVFRRSVLLVTLPWLVIYMLLGTLLVFLGTAATGAGLPTKWLAVAIGGGGMVLLLTQPTFGRYADRFGRLRLMMVGTAGFVGVLAGASLLTAYGPRPEALAIVGVSAVAALAYGPAALAALADLSRELTRATTMAIYSLTISLGMLVGVLGSTQLYRRFGNNGLYVFFGVVAVGLVILTLVRYWDVQQAKNRVPV
jgi:MFS family permease